MAANKYCDGQQRARTRVFHIFSKAVENLVSPGERWRSVFKKVSCWPQASSVHAHGSFIFFRKAVENSVSPGEGWRSVFKKVPCWPQASSVHAHGHFTFFSKAVENSVSPEERVQGLAAFL